MVKAFLGVMPLTPPGVGFETMQAPTDGEGGGG